MHVGFGKCGKLRALHADVGALTVDGHSTKIAGFGKDGVVYMLAIDPGGNWLERTSAIMRSVASEPSGVAPSTAVVAKGRSPLMLRSF